MRQSRSRLASLSIIALLAISACAHTESVMGTPDVAVPTTIETANGTYQMDLRNNTRALTDTIAVGVDRAWAALPGVYNALGLTGGGVIDSDDHMYGVSGARLARIDGKHLDEYLDCGSGMSGPRANVDEVRVTAITRLIKNAAGGTRVETLVSASAKPRGVSVNPVRCSSRATLEPLIVQRLRGSSR